MAGWTTLWAALLLAAAVCTRTVAAQASNETAVQPADPFDGRPIQASNGTAVRPADPYFEGRTIQVCTSDYEPIMGCIDRDPSQYSG